MTRQLNTTAALCATIMTLTTGWTDAFAATPTVVPYAGYLTGADGQPYEGSVDVMVALYPCATAGDGTCDSVWSVAPWVGVEVSRGLLQFELGGENESPLAQVLGDHEELWLEVALKTDGAVDWTLLEPRHRLLAVPYAVSAHDSDRLGGMIAADYATAAEIETLVGLEEIAAAGYMTPAELALAGYATSETLLDYVLSSTLEAQGYLTTDDLVQYVTQAALTQALDEYSAVVTGMISINLEPYVTQESLDDQLTSYLPVDDAYTDQQAIDAVEAAGYALEANLLEKYTNQEAVQAVAAAGYVQQAFAMKSLHIGEEGSDASSDDGEVSSATMAIEPATALGTVVVDLQVAYELNYTPPVAAALLSQHWATSVICQVSRSLDDAPEFYFSQKVFGTFLYDSVTPNRQENGVVSVRVYDEPPEEWRTAGYQITVNCTPDCGNQGAHPEASCVMETNVSASVTTF